MPDIHELLHDALPPMHGYDEDDVRRRLGRRRRARRAVGGLVAVAVIVGAIGVYALAQDDGGEPVVADEPTTGQWSAFGATSIAIVGDQIWIGGQGFVSLGDGTGRIDMPGQVVGLAAGDVLWAHGDRWVAAIDPASKKVLGTWDGTEIGDIQPLAGQEVAISQPDDDTVEIVRTAAEGLEEIWAVPVGDHPTHLVLTTSNQLWVNESLAGTISEIDVGAQGVVDTCNWGGALLAPALDGTIWAGDGSRVVALDTAVLRTGALSAAQGQRYDVAASMAVETPFGLYIGGPGGVTRFSPTTEQGEVITNDAPSAIAASGGQLAYVTNGEVRTAVAGPTSPVDPEAWRHEPRQVAARYLSEELKWPDVIIESDEQTDEFGSIVHATSESLARDANVTLHRSEVDTWSVTGLWTFDFDGGGTIDLGHGADVVRHVYGEAGLTPVVLVRYGDQATRRTGKIGEAPRWEGDLGFVDGERGSVQVLWLNADGVAVEGWLQSLPPGPSSVG